MNVSWENTRGNHTGKEPFTDYRKFRLREQLLASAPPFPDAVRGRGSSRGRAQSDSDVDTRRAPRSQSSEMRYSQQKAQHKRGVPSTV